MAMAELILIEGAQAGPKVMRLFPHNKAILLTMMTSLNVKGAGSILSSWKKKYEIES